MLAELSFGNGSRCCLPSWHASHTRSTRFDSKAGSLITTPFDFIPRSRWRFTWPILLCHNSMFVSVLRPLVCMADFTSFESRMNMRPSLRLFAMSRPSFSMKQPSLLKRICMPCSTIWPTETNFFVMVGTCKTFCMQVVRLLSRMGHCQCAEWDAACHLRSQCGRVDPTFISHKTTVGVMSCDARRRSRRTMCLRSWRYLRSWRPS